MDKQFTNEVITNLNIPQIELEDFVLIERKHRTYLLFRNSFWFLLLLLIPVILFFVIDENISCLYYLIPIVCVFMMWSLSITLVLLNFPQKAYLIRQKDISYKRGCFFRKLTTVPLNRIQHVEIKQSPIARMFGLSKIVVFTAGGSSSDLSISGLLPSKAEKIKQYLTQKISSAEEFEPIVNILEND